MLVPIRHGLQCFSVQTSVDRPRVLSLSRVERAPAGHVHALLTHIVGGTHATIMSWRTCSWKYPWTRQRPTSHTSTALNVSSILQSNVVQFHTVWHVSLTIDVIGALCDVWECPGQPIESHNRAVEITPRTLVISPRHGLLLEKTAVHWSAQLRTGTFAFRLHTQEPARLVSAPIVNVHTRV